MLDGYGLTAASLLIAQVAFNIFIAANSPVLVKSYGEASAGSIDAIRTGSMWWAIVSTISYAVLYGVIAVMIIFVQNSKTIDNVLIGILVLAVMAAIGIAIYLYSVVNTVALANINRSQSLINEFGVPPNPGGDWAAFFESYKVIMTYPAHAAVSAAIVGTISSVLLFNRRYQNVAKLLGGLRTIFG